MNSFALESKSASFTFMFFSKSASVQRKLLSPEEFPRRRGFAVFPALVDNVEKIGFRVAAKIQHLLRLFLLLLLFSFLPHFLSMQEVFSDFPKFLSFLFLH